MFDCPRNLLRIALTPGEPAGIGPDLCIQLAQQVLPCQLVAVACPELLVSRARLLGLPLKVKLFTPSSPLAVEDVGTLWVLPVELAHSVVCGRLNAGNSGYVLETLKLAVNGCLSGAFSAMVTGPVHKGIINEGGFSFSGHTEFIADITGGYPVMMLATPGLRVALVTIHLPLSQVSASITPERLSAVIEVLVHDLRTRFGIVDPCILVCGLNPHAGEGGHLGTEEIDVISPVLDKFRRYGVNVIGPLPADSLFTAKYLDKASAVLAMYHDQGLPVLKFKGFGRAVNITLGLPIVRTSVDHGTALDLAGSGSADAGSLRYALETALSLAHSG